MKDVMRLRCGETKKLPSKNSDLVQIPGTILLACQVVFQSESPVPGCG